MALRLFIFLILLSAAFKDDAASAKASFALGGLTWDPLVTQIKAHSQYLFFVATIPGFWLVLQANLKFKKNEFALIYCTLLTFGVARALLADEIFAMKLFGTMVITAWLMIVLNAAQVRYQPEECFKNIQAGAYASFLAFIFLNLLNIKSGHGYVPGNPRLFGTSIHPNFLGVQAALSCLVCASQVLKKDLTLSQKAIRFLPLLASVAILVMTGSRTGLLMFGIGMIALLSISNNWSSARTGIVIAGLAIVIGSLAIIAPEQDNDDQGISSSYQRGGEGGGDTRTEAWSSMLDEIQSDPILGVGYFEGKSENSYLRAAVVFGIFYALSFVAFILALAATCVRAKTFHVQWQIRQKALWTSILLALAAGAFFEGYLLDSFSLPIFFLSIIVGIIPSLYMPHAQNHKFP